MKVPLWGFRGLHHIIPFTEALVTLIFLKKIPEIEKRCRQGCKKDLSVFNYFYQIATALKFNCLFLSLFEAGKLIKINYLCAPKSELKRLSI